VLDIIGGHSPLVRVDVIGVGSSVYDHLQPYLGTLVEPVTANASPSPGNGQRYHNRRAEDYWSLRDRLDPANSVLELPPDPVLYSELTAPAYTVTARGIQINAKEQIIKMLGRSPDLADSVVLACSMG
tara:strand:- start:49 stop:432 length:384 start_codon:yes stop_codon:yes gene_type:complete